jgi:hypothetical protein
MIAPVDPYLDAFAAAGDAGGAGGLRRLLRRAAEAGGIGRFKSAAARSRIVAA